MLHGFRRSAVLLLAVLLLAGCETSAPSARDPEPVQATEPGVHLSGYARVGVKKTF